MKFRLSTLSTTLSIAISVVLMGAAGVLISACNSAEEGHVHIKGHFEHLQQTTLFIYSDDTSTGGVDTIQVVGGDFEYDCQLTEPTVMTLVYPNFTDLVFVAEPTTMLKYHADANKLMHASISGTAANDSLTAFRHRYAAKPLSAQQKAAESYVRQHPDDPASIALFAQYFERAQVVNHEPASSLLALLSKAHTKNKGVALMSNRMTPLLQTGIGAKPSADLLKPSTLYIFTLSTQYQSAEMRRVATEATENSAINLVEISLDTLDFNAARLKYGLRYIPGNLLLDKEGRIADRDIPADRLKEALK